MESGGRSGSSSSHRRSFSQFAYPELSPTNSEGMDDTGSDDEPVYCVCRKPEQGWMIGCERCDEWYHGKCIGIDKSKGDRLPNFVCHRCNDGALLGRDTTFCCLHNSSHDPSFITAHLMKHRSNNFFAPFLALNWIISAWNMRF